MRAVRAAVALVGIPVGLVVWPGLSKILWDLVGPCERP